MRPLVQLISTAFLISVLVFACKKSSTPPDPGAINVTNLSATYQVTDAKGTYLGLTIDLYDSLQACQKDNLIQLNKDSTALLIDAGIACMPPQNSSGTWLLNTTTDSIYVTGLGSNYIQSFDGKTLVLKGPQTYNSISFVATTTLVKQ